MWHHTGALGEVSERSKEHAWKVCVRSQRTEGSNPSLSATSATVNALAPGVVDTDTWTLIDEQTAKLRGMEVGEPKRRRVRRVPTGRAATRATSPPSPASSPRRPPIT